MGCGGRGPAAGHPVTGAARRRGGEVRAPEGGVQAMEDQGLRSVRPTRGSARSDGAGPAGHGAPTYQLSAATMPRTGSTRAPTAPRRGERDGAAVSFGRPGAGDAARRGRAAPGGHRAPAPGAPCPSRTDRRRAAAVAGRAGRTRCRAPAAVAAVAEQW